MGVCYALGQDEGGHDTTDCRLSVLNSCFRRMSALRRARPVVPSRHLLGSSPKSRNVVFGLDAQNVQRESGAKTSKVSKSCKDREYRSIGTHT